MLDDDELFAIFNVSHGSLRAVAEAARRDALEEAVQLAEEIADSIRALIEGEQ